MVVVLAAVAAAVVVVVTVGRRPFIGEGQKSMPLFEETQTQISRAIGNNPPLCAHMPLPALRSHTPGRPRTPGYNRGPCWSLPGGGEISDSEIGFSLRIWAFHVKRLERHKKNSRVRCKWSSDDPFCPFLANPGCTIVRHRSRSGRLSMDQISQFGHKEPLKSARAARYCLELSMHTCGRPVQR